MKRASVSASNLADRAAVTHIRPTIRRFETAYDTGTYCYRSSTESRSAHAQ